ncbi:MAG: hypothetical protein RLN87_09245 [Parasphingopyxis sp.]|uniref:hypothetical protein n=1 Tax=Parasphingopyxis sp. TaxID=1920299 RepID=UPI0032EF7340
MRHESQHEYWERRAEQELRLAHDASDPQAARIHYHLAGRYLNLLHDRSEKVNVAGHPVVPIME